MLASKAVWARVLGSMTNTNQKKEDEVLKRMLKTPPKPHKPMKARKVGDTQRNALIGGMGTTDDPQCPTNPIYYK